MEPMGACLEVVGDWLQLGISDWATGEIPVMLSLTLPTKEALHFTFPMERERTPDREARILAFYADSSEDSEQFPPKMGVPVVQARSRQEERTYFQARLNATRQRVQAARRRYLQEDIEEMLAWYRGKLQVILSSRDSQECHDAADAISNLAPEKVDLLSRLLYLDE